MRRPFRPSCVTLLAAPVVGRVCVVALSRRLPFITRGARLQPLFAAHGVLPKIYSPCPLSLSPTHSADETAEKLTDEETVNEALSEKISETEKKLEDALEALSSLRDQMAEDQDREIDVLQESHEEEVSKLKERLEEQMSLVDRLRESHKEELEAAKEAHKVELEAANERHQGQIDTMKEHHERALEEVKIIDGAGLKLERELERKKYQSILDEAFAKQGKELEDVVAQYQALLDAAEAETAKVCEEKRVAVEKLEADAAAAASEAKGCREIADQLVEERETHAEKTAMAEARVKSLEEEIKELLPHKANACAKSESSAADVLTAKERTKEAMECVSALEDVIRSLRTWAMRARVHAKTRGWTEAEVEEAFEGFVTAVSRADEVTQDAAARGLGGGASGAAARELKDKLASVSSSEVEHERALELLAAMRKEREEADEAWRQQFEGVSGRMAASAKADAKLSMAARSSGLLGLGVFGL